MKKKLISLLSLLTVLIFVMPTVVFAVEGLGDISADDEVSLVEIAGPPNGKIVSEAVSLHDPVADTPLEEIPVDEWSIENSNELMAKAEAYLLELYEAGALVALNFGTEDIDNESSILSDQSLLAHSLAQLRFVNMDPRGETPKYAVVYGTQVTNGWLEDPEGSNRWYYLENGVKQTGWKKIDGLWYYFYNATDTSSTNYGLMAIGIIPMDSFYYYFDDWGAMQHGWRYMQVSGWDTSSYWRFWGYPGNSNTGAMQKYCWMCDSENEDTSREYWYRFDTAGRMLSNTTYVESGII